MLDHPNDENITPTILLKLNSFETSVVILFAIPGRLYIPVYKSVSELVSPKFG